MKKNLLDNMPVAVPIYSKEELFCMLQLAKSRNIKADINPHKFPLLEVIKGIKDVFITYHPLDGMDILTIDATGVADILKNRNLNVISLSEFFRCMGIELDEFFKIVYKNRKHIYSPVLDSGNVSINGIDYPIKLVEEIIEIPFNDFIVNLEYELSLSRKEEDDGN